jgi:hypothetical protein
MASALGLVVKVDLAVVAVFGALGATMGQDYKYHGCQLGTESLVIQMEQMGTEELLANQGLEGRLWIFLNKFNYV